MLVLYGGKQRGMTDLTTLVAGAGLTVAAVHPVGTFAIIELRQARATHEPPQQAHGSPT